MNILLICNKSPWPPREGGPIAMNAMVEGLLNAGHKVKVLAINSYKYFIDPQSVPSDYSEKTQIELVYMDLKVRPMHALLNLLSSKSYHVQRFISDDFADAIRKILQNNEFDVIQLETLFVTPYIDLIRKHSKAAIFLRAHNIEHLIWERLYKREKNSLKKFYLGHLSRTLKKFELRVLTKLDGIIAITQKDADFFKRFVPAEKVIAIPFGILPEIINKYLKVNIEPVQNTIFHLGSMNWMPNQEGIQWFLKEVWPGLSVRNKDLVFRLAGREMPVWLLNRQTGNVIIDGEVPDAVEYMKKYRIMVVPLFSGSGIRIKIIEGMLAGCAIITTRTGAEGINCQDGKHLIFAENSEEYIQAIERLVNDQALVDEIGNNASAFVRENHNNQKLMFQLESFYTAQRN
ncbi:MAG: glycosyltransferase family 4 protein [Chloroflexota bacterium]